jgi:hypothetical protein
MRTFDSLLSDSMVVPHTCLVIAALQLASRLHTKRKSNRVVNEYPLSHSAQGSECGPTADQTLRWLCLVSKHLYRRLHLRTYGTGFGWQRGPIGPYTPALFLFRSVNYLTVGAIVLMKVSSCPLSPDQVP